MWFDASKCCGMCRLVRLGLERLMMGGPGEIGKCLISIGIRV